MGDTDLKELIEKAGGGDQIAWNELVSGFQRRVFAAAIAVMGNPEDADEIAQEVFVKFHANIKKLNSPSAASAWLVRTSANLAYDRRRFRSIRKWFSPSRGGIDFISSDESSNPEREVGRKQMMEAFDRWAKAKLSNKERLVVQLKVGEEMTFKEISDAMGISSSTAKTHYERAMRKFERMERNAKGEFDHE